MKNVVLIGLHITKCAGTTLADHARKNLPPKHVYLCSSAWNNANEASQEFAERLKPEDTKFIFGHYVHESLLDVFRGRQMVWFTGVREPVSRAVSEYYQMCKVRFQAGLPPLNAQEYLSARKNTICRELMRAFPSIDRSVKGGLAQRAFAALQCFDLIYSPEDFTKSTDRLLQLVGVRSEGMVPRNIRAPREADAAFLAEQEAMITDAAPQNFAQDMELYELLRPYFGCWQPFASSDRDRRPLGQAQFFAPATEDANGLTEFRSHIARYFVRDFLNVGRKAELQALVEKKAAWLNALTDNLREMDALNRK